MGGIQAAGQLQAICNQIMERDKVNGVQILTWRHLPAHDEIINDEEEIE